MKRTFVLTCAFPAAALAACAHAPPRIDGGAGAPARPSEFWVPPASVTAPAAPAARPVAPVMQAALERLTLANIVEIALRNNPATRISWAQARAAADNYGASRGPLVPLLTAGVTASRTKTATAVNGVERTQYGPSASLSYMVLDLGGRAGSIDAARSTAITADFSHNVTVQNTILQTEGAAFAYLATRALRGAQRAAVDEAAANLAAAEERHRVGLATIADVLQARTARSQEELDLETLDGQLTVTRGGLAVAMGLPANTALEAPDVTAPDSTTVAAVSESVDSLISLAYARRPDLAAARADADRAAAQVRIEQSAGRPSLSVTASLGYVGSDRTNFAGRNYALNLGIAVPLFSGFANTYGIHSAEAQLDAAGARVESTRQQIALQVFASWYALQTAAQRVRTSAQLLASAEESEAVARGRYQEGVGSIVDLLLAQSTLANARAQSVGSGWQWRTALAQLAHDAGVLGIHGEPTVPLGAPGGGR